MPDSPAVSELGSLSHAVFDQEFVHAFQHRSQWTRAKDVGETPRFSMQDFYAFTRLKLADTLRSHPSFRRHRYQLDGPVMDHFAHIVTARTASVIHLRQQSLCDTLYSIRSHLIRAFVEGTIRADEPHHPLWGMGEKGRDAQEGMEIWRTSIAPHRRKKEHEFLKEILGTSPLDKNDHTLLQPLLTEAVPFLLSLDRTHVEVVEEEFRTKMWMLLRGHSFLDQGTREALKNMLLDHWAEGQSNLDDHLLAIATQIRRAELLALNESQLKELFRNYGCKPPRVSREERVEKLLSLESNRAGGTPLRLDDPAQALPTIRRCFGSLMQGEEEFSPDIRRKIIERLPVLEFHLINACQTGEEDLAHCLIAYFLEIQQRSHLTWKEYPPMAWAYLSFGATHAKVDINRWRSNL